MVTLDAVKQGMTRYFEVECASKADGIGKFAAYFMLPSIPNMVGKKIDEMQSTGLLDDIIKDGMIDLDVAASRARNAMVKCGSVELMGFRLNASDVDKLVEYIRSSQC